jgi:hypothetical protein
MNPLRGGVSGFPYGGEFVRLKLIVKPSRCCMVSFTPPVTGDPHVIRAVDRGDGFVFESDGSVPTYRRRFRWIADLKYEQAQRDISGFASYISRVGLDESEWLRRSAK